MADAKQATDRLGVDLRVKGNEDAVQQETHNTSGTIIVGDAFVGLGTLDADSVQCCVTSPPYWGLRDYELDGQVGAEKTVEEYIATLERVFLELWRVLKPDGTLWLNIGDSYTSGNRGWRHKDKRNPARGMDYRPATPSHLKSKELIGVPWKLAFALQRQGWYLRSDIIWFKSNGQPESVKDRPSRAHEYLFLLSKQEHYYYDYDAVLEPADNGGERNRRTVWTLKTHAGNGGNGESGSQPAAFPEELIRPCIDAGSRPGDVVLDPFFGTGTTGVVSAEAGRSYVGIELNPSYAQSARERLEAESDQGVILIELKP